jgi:DNA-binding response OmpR family regulator
MLLENRMSRPVLVVDDNPTIRALLIRVLRRSKAQIEILDAERGGDALILSRKHQPGLVLLDQHLPDRCGLDVLCDLKQAHRAPYVIMITGDGGVQRIASARGADETWIKPLDVVDMLDHLVGLLPRVLQ